MFGLKFVVLCLIIPVKLPFLHNHLFTVWPLMFFAISSLQSQNALHILRKHVLLLTVSL